MLLKQLFVPLTTKKAISIIIILGFIVFGNALFNGFVWDDKGFIIGYFSTHHLNLVALFGPNRFNDTRFYRPIPAVYFALLYSIFENQAFFYHFSQVVLHIISAIMLYLLFNALFGTIDAKANEKEEKEWNSLSGSQKIKYQRKYGSVVKASHVLEPKIKLLSLFLSLVFLVHPINVESVSFIGATQSELYFLPGILALYLARKKQISVTRFLLINGLLFLSLFTKETGLLFLLLVILYRYIFLGNLRKVTAYLVSGTLITGVYLSIRIFIGGVGFHNIKQDVPIAALPLSERLLNIPAIMLYYLKTFVFPAKLVIWQSWVVKTMADENFIIPLIICLVLFLAFFYADFLLNKHNRTQFKVFIFFTLWYLLGMGLIAQIVPLDMTVSDRWFYFPVVGVLGMVGIGLKNLVKTETAQKVVVSCCIGILILLSIRTIVRNTNFYNDMTLYTHDSGILDNTFIENNLGLEYATEKNYREALKHFQKSMGFQPTILNMQNSMNMYEIEENKQAAREIAVKILNLNINDYTMNNYDGAVVNASGLLLYYDTPQYAKDFILHALQKDPNSSYLWANLALSNYMQQNQREALVDAEKAKTLNPSEQTNYLYTFILQHKDNIPSSLIFKR